jgi:xanthine dehydrogenase YagS FAD-binding subunit
MLQSFAYVRPRTLTEALKLAAEPGAQLHAGGTDLVGCLRDHVLEARQVVSLSGLQELRGTGPSPDGGLRLGALTTIAEIAGDAGIKEKYRALADAASVVASPQLRNQGTIGGNLCQRPRCWYFRGDYECTRKGGDTCYAMDGENQYHAVFGGSACWIVHPSDTAPALIALDARVRLTGPKGSRTLPLEKFFVLPEDNVKAETVLEPGEVLVDVLLPAPAAGLRSSYRKVRARGSWDFALAGMALALTVKPDRKVASARVVFSGVAPTPWRALNVEQAVLGRALDAKTIAKAADAAVVGARPLAQNAYKLDLLRGLVSDEFTKISLP